MSKKARPVSDTRPHLIQHSSAREQEILDRLATGETLTDICRDPHLPDRLIVLRWKREDPEFRALYQDARVSGMETWADEIISIADDGRNDWMERNDPNNAGYAYNGEAAARSRLRIDTRKFLMAKVAPTIYGDRVAVTGAEGGPVITEIRRVIVRRSELSSETDTSDISEF